MYLLKDNLCGEAHPVGVIEQNSGHHVFSGTKLVFNPSEIWLTSESSPHCPEISGLQSRQF